eukprot:6201014-Pleurochrysis_carterae.AAC.1
MSKQSRDTNASNGGARRRAGASLSHGREQPSSGSDSQPRLDGHSEHMLGTQNAMEGQIPTTNARVPTESGSRTS